MRQLSAPRPETLRPPHDNPPAPDDPPPPARQPSKISTTNLRPRQPSATGTATLRDQHGNPPDYDNSPRRTTRAISAQRQPGRAAQRTSAGTTRPKRHCAITRTKLRDAAIFRVPHGYLFMPAATKQRGGPGSRILPA